MAKEDDRQTLLTYLEERFGIHPGVFKHYLFFSLKKSWWLLRNSPEIHKASQFKVSMVGLNAFRRVGRHYIKPTTKMIQKFGGHATKGFVQINDKQLARLLSGETIMLEEHFENGYVILRLEGMTLGLGLVIDEGLKSQLPKRWVLYSRDKERR